MMDLPMGKFKDIAASLYADTCVIITQASGTDVRTGAEVSGSKTLISGQPCRISRYSTNGETAAGQPGTPDLDSDWVLFLSQDVQVPEGCIISVDHLGTVEDYDRSGPPAVYSTHQEVPVKLRKRYA